MTKKFDYIICGAGLSGLIMVDKMFKDRFFDNKSVLLIEKDLAHKSQKTWCFWEEKHSQWDDYVIKSWDNVSFKSTNSNKETHLNHYSYKMVKSTFFVNSIINKIRNEKNFTIIEDEVSNIFQEDNLVTIKTNLNVFKSDFVFNSLFNLSDLKSNFPLLIQHFKGWTIETDNEFFNDKVATIMDFSIKQKNDTRFFYVLPISKKRALIEFTLFSRDYLKDEEYDDELRNYINSLGIDSYKIIEKEKGAIPMTCHPFENKNSERIIHIGTAGGWTKPSSGYTFKFIDKNTDKLISYLKGNDFSKTISFKTRHWAYDLIFLDVLFNENHIGKKLFEKMFNKNKTENVFRFLDNDSSIVEEISIAYSFPKYIFTKSLFKNLGKIFKYYL